MKKLIFLIATGFFLSAQAQQPTNTNQPMQSTPNQSNQPNQSTQPNQSNPNQRNESTQPNQQNQQNQQNVLQDRDVPNSVSSAFNKAYPNISDVKWRRDGNNYKAIYATADNMNTIIIYDASGNLIKTKNQIETSQLPSGVMDYVSRNYNKDMDKVKEAYRVTDANGTVTYKTEVKGMHLIFDSQGNFIRSEKKNVNDSSSSM